MSRWNRKQLVLDASLAAGSNDLMFNPTGDIAGDRNRRCLQAVWEEEHFAVFNRQLQREWRDHAGAFARAWLQRMAQKNRVVWEEGGEFSDLKHPACSCQVSEVHGSALEKDFHLVQSALSTGQLIVSNETKLPKYIAVACGSVEKLLALYYGNPVVEGEECRLWIKSGAEKAAHRRIDVWAENHVSDD